MPASSTHSWACRCPYYRTAEDGLYGTLTITADEGGYADTYWDSLTTTTLSNSQCGIDLAGFPDKYKSAFLAAPDSPTCGQWLQFTSQYPGSGPCYPVLVQTVDHLNRWGTPLTTLKCEKSKGKTTPLSVNFMRSQRLCRAAQGCEV